MDHREILKCNRRYYDVHVPPRAASDATIELTALHREFIACLPARGRVLDLGCGLGRDARLFTRCGLRVTAIDASPPMVKHCVRLGLDARVQTIQQLGGRARFDGVWANGSLLHLAKAEIADALTRVVRTMRSSGVLFVSLRAGKGEGLCPDGRYAAFYTKREFLALLRDQGELVPLRTWSLRQGAARGRWWCFLARRSG